MIETEPLEERAMPKTITYQGAAVLAGALAHLLREEGVEFDPPREQRTGVAEVAVLVIDVRAGNAVSDQPLDAMIGAAVAKFEKRFGDDAASIEITDGDSQG
jgi:hypothetical protein